MNKGKKGYVKENWLIYIGTAIFFILAISIGIVMYMAVNKETGINEKDGENPIISEETESATTDIGKTVEEQKENQNNTIVNNENTNPNINTDKSNNNTNISTNSNKETNTTLNNSNTNTTEKVEENKVTETKKEISFVKPTDGEIICEYAKDNLIYSETLKEWITHKAIDIKADKTSIIKAAAEGIVKSIVNDPRYGLTVVIEHDDGYETVYSNLLTAEFVIEGEEVEQGQTIGTAGNTAAFESSMESHLHFELLKDGEYLDPSIYLK